MFKHVPHGRTVTEVELVPNDHMTYTVLSRKREVIEAWERIGRSG